MSQVICNRNKNVYISLVSVHHEIVVERKLVLEVLSFHMLCAWVKHRFLAPQNLKREMCIKQKRAQNSFSPEFDNNLYQAFNLQ